MTISSETRKAGPFPGNGVTTAFPFAFKVFAAADLAVTLNVLATGVQTTLTLTSDYTVALNPDQNANPGGTVTYNPSGVPMLSTKTLTIGSVLTNTQGYQPTNSGGWLPDNAENAWDRAVILIQQSTEKLARSLKFPIVDGALTSELPPAAQRANNLLGFDASGNVVAVAPAAQSASALQTLLADPVTSAPLLGFVISQDVTLNVPSQYATIAAALAVLTGRLILSTATVTIKVADGTYNLTATTTANHPDGSRIKIIGNETTPANCILSVAGSGFDCLLVTNGNTLGYLNGFKFLKTVKALAADNTTAVLANNGATIICGPKIVVDNWYYGIAARNGSFILCDFASVDHSGDVGIWAFVGSTIQCRSAVSNNAIDVASNLGFGIQAEYGSSIDCQNASATGCRIGGIASLSNSQVRALSATASSNTGSGFFARDGGTIEAHNGIANTNTRYGIEEIGTSRVLGAAMTLTGNTIAATKNAVYLDNDALGARLAANGDFRIDLNGTDNWFFNSLGGLQFGISHTASAVNRFNVSGSATGGPVRLSAVGSDTNITASVEAKGAGVVRSASNGKTALQAFNPSASAVNYVQVNGSVTGAAVELTAQGTDAVIDLALLPLGAGSYVKLGAGFVGTGDVVCNGYIPIKDNVGTVRKLMVTA